ncbi:CEP19-like protein-domain-containing protein [Powellomyces hirtus]|nr:CEP19-like protein-domain-containing protein [Powellomyces hirtus]
MAARVSLPIPSFLTKDIPTIPSKQDPGPASVAVPIVRRKPAPQLKKTNVSPKTFAVRYNTPALVLFYTARDTGRSRRRSMPLRATDKSTTGEIVQKLRDRHNAYLRTVKVEQLKRLVALVHKPGATGPNPNTNPQVIAAPDTTSWLKSDAKLASAAPSMLGGLPPLSKKPASLEGVKSSGVLLDSLLSKARAGDVKPLQKTGEAPPMKIDGTKDLNKLGDKELSDIKDAMNTDFEKNRVKPGDPGYVYDVQKSFGPAVEANDWDDESDVEVPSAIAATIAPQPRRSEPNEQPAEPPAKATSSSADDYDIEEDIEEYNEEEDEADGDEAEEGGAVEDQASEGHDSFGFSNSTPGSNKGNSSEAIHDRQQRAKDVYPDSLMLSDDEDVGIEAEIRRIEREERVAAANGKVGVLAALDKSLTDDVMSPPSVMSHASATRTPVKEQPLPTPARIASKLAPLPNAITQLTPLGKPQPVELTTASSTTSFSTTAPLVSATTPAPVSTLPIEGDDDVVSEDIEEFDIESEDDDDVGYTPSAPTTITNTDSAAAAAPTSLSGLPPLAGMTTAKPVAAPLAAPASKYLKIDLTENKAATPSSSANDKKNEHEGGKPKDDDDVSSDFGAGHTDDEILVEDEDDQILVEDPSDDDEEGEIVFSDDGLSYDDGDKDGGF